MSALKGLYFAILVRIPMKTRKKEEDAVLSHRKAKRIASSLGEQRIHFFVKHSSRLGSLLFALFLSPLITLMIF
jgi:hypothetical protein